MSNEWKSLSISEVSEIIGGGTPKTKNAEYWNGDIPWLSVVDFNNDLRFVETTEKKITSSGLANSSTKLLSKGDLIISARGTVGALAQLIKPMTFNQSCYGIKAKEIVDSGFLYYAIKNIISTVKMNTHGSVFDTITKDTFNHLFIPVPSIEEQRKIADVLTVLDKKIHSNVKQTKVLEEMAQAIFKNWFVDFEPFKDGEFVDSELGLIPSGWSIKKLSDIVESVKEATKPGDHLKSRRYNPIETLPMKSVAMSEFKDSSDAQSSLLLFEKYDILVGAMRVYFHRVSVSPYKGVTRTTTFVLRSKNVNHMPFNLFLINREETIAYADKISKGSTMPYATWENGLAELKIIHPSEEYIDLFSKTVYPFIEQIFINSNENLYLKDVRDLLLPKLMSGEIRVPNVEV